MRAGAYTDVLRIDISSLLGKSRSSCLIMLLGLLLLGLLLLGLGLLGLQRWAPWLRE